MRRALEQSLNSATIRIAIEIGLPEVIQTAQRLGLAANLAPVPAMALGAFEVTPLDLARAYLPFVNGGSRLGPSSTIRIVSDGDGVDVTPAREAPAVAISSAEAYLMTSLLAGCHGAPRRPRARRGTGDVAASGNDQRPASVSSVTRPACRLVCGLDTHPPRLSGAQAALHGADS